ncbi:MULTISPECIES: DUF1003 domain-containing protein [Hyphomicrobiales]|jgi:uncharacterized membrane protein|uniref:DUF1003 domain-containing protein n=1 Tax=Bosea massiliensis TaxID=151419 RepID=A0ABW0P5T8_9HYPH|nr:DUF1003 domain-containing protein [Bradyrhizobium sp. CCH1-B1]
MTHPDPSAETGLCALTGRTLPRRHLIGLDALRPALAEAIRRDHPDLPAHALVSQDAVAGYRSRYINALLASERGEMTELDRQVAESLASSELITSNTDDEIDRDRTFGQRLADHVASFGGSWAFLISFGVVLAVWMTINVVGVASFDPYPFILLNLALSCVAAVQAPVIMMSQQRQEAKDRARARNDYQVNLKAELEIRHLHEKMDHLVNRQWQRLAEIQEVQIELLQELRSAQASDASAARAASSTSRARSGGSAKPRGSKT